MNKLLFLALVATILLLPLLAIADKGGNGNGNGNGGHGGDKGDDKGGDNGRSGHFNFPGAGGGGGSGSDGHGPNGHRRLDKQLQAHSVRINARNTTADQKTVLQVDFTTNGFPRLRLSRFNATNTTFTTFTFRIGLRRFIEFNDTNNDCFFNDTILSQFSLIGFSQRWTVLARTDLTLLDNNNNTVNVTKYCTSLTQHGTTVTLCLKIADAPIFDNTNHSVGPSRVKLDVALDNYRFVANGTKLALIAFAASKVKASNSTELPRLILFNNDGTVDWDGIIDTEVGPMNVHASALRSMSSVEHGEQSGGDGDDDDPFRQEEMEAAVSFCIDNTTHALHYMWDPSVEINDLTAESTVSTSAAMSLSSANLWLLSVVILLVSLLFSQL